MPQKTYLVNKSNNTKFRLNGIIRSNNSSEANNVTSSAGTNMLFGGGNLPPKVDLRPDLTSVENQSTLASCVANSLAGAYEYLLKKATGRTIDVSRLFIYYNARKKGIEMTQGEIEDGGCVMTDAIETLKEFGVCLESIWPYNNDRVNDRPSEQAYQEARDHKIDEAIALDINLEQMKSCLAQGFPFAFGLQLFSTFDKASEKGVVPMPNQGDVGRGTHGSHAMLAVGYSDQSQAFIVRNSWGTDWGDEGYCYIPYDYLANSQYSFDIWTVKKVMSHDFGQENWSYEDNYNYTDNKDQTFVDYNDNDNHTIETWDDNNGGRTDYDPWSQPDNQQTDVDYYDPYQNNQDSSNTEFNYYDNQYQTTSDTSGNDQYNYQTTDSYTEYTSDQNNRFQGGFSDFN